MGGMVGAGFDPIDFHELGLFVLCGIETAG
jgi:hypothetical protein